MQLRPRRDALPHSRSALLRVASAGEFLLLPLLFVAGDVCDFPSAVAPGGIRSTSRRRPIRASSPFPFPVLPLIPSAGSQSVKLPSSMIAVNCFPLCIVCLSCLSLSLSLSLSRLFRWCHFMTFPLEPMTLKGIQKNQFNPMAPPQIDFSIAYFLPTTAADALV